MSTTTDTPVAADVQATDEADDKSTATTTPAVDEKKETSKVNKLDTAEADKEIAEDLAKEDESDEADDTDETEKPDKKAKEEETEEKSEEKSDEETAEEAETKAKGAEARKQQIQNEIREAIRERDQIRAQNKANIERSYRTETPEELEEQGLSPEDAEKEIMRQENEMLKFTTHVNDLNDRLNIESLQVMQDYPVFDPDSPLYDEQLSNRVKTLYERAAQTEVDPKTNLVLKSNLPPYEFYKAFAETHQVSGEKSRVQGQIDGQKAADKELAAAEVPSGTAPKTQKQDPFLKGLTSTDD